MTTQIYEDWMRYTEQNKDDFYGKIVPKKNAPEWVKDKIDKFYEKLEDGYIDI